jgi:hypothetical protein
MRLRLCPLEIYTPSVSKKKTNLGFKPNKPRISFFFDGRSIYHHKIENFEMYYHLFGETKQNRGISRYLKMY